MKKPTKRIHQATGKILAALGITSLVLLGGGVAQAADDACPKMGVKELTGAGATFPFPLYSKMFDEYNKLCGVKVNYQSIGSGGGIRQMQEMTVDFGASDGTVTDQQKAQMKGGAIIHIPIVAGSEAVVYNLPGIASGTMKLTPDVIADIYLKKIKKWNDHRIVSLNPGVKLPDLDIAVVHRSDGSGTTFIWTNYLSKVSKDWADKVGFATSVNWPGDIGGAGNEGVANQVKQIPGAIGYVELAYALQNKMPWVQVRNKAGKYRRAEPGQDGGCRRRGGPSGQHGIHAHRQRQPGGLSDCRLYLAAALPKPERTQAQGDAVVRLAWWMTHDGQKYATPLEYAPLKGAAVKKTEALLKKINSTARPILATN